jgi:hypothetical protein
MSFLPIFFLNMLEPLFWTCSSLSSFTTSFHITSLLIFYFCYYWRSFLAAISVSWYNLLLWFHVHFSPKHCSSVFLPTITTIIKSVSLNWCLWWPDQALFGSASSKKSTFGKDIFTNYRLISHLPFLSELIERVIQLRFSSYLSNNNFFNSFQSSDIKSHSTETALLTVHE